MIYLGIDPGGSGGIAAIDRRGAVALVGPTPATDLDVFIELAELARRCEREGWGIHAAIEHVWSTPGQGGAFKFGVSVGALRMALAAAGIPYDPVLPKKWQKALGVVYAKGLTDTQKKNITKARAQQLFPGTPITHATADALLIAEYCRRQREHHHGEEDRREEARAQARHQEREAEGAPGHGPGAAHQARRPLHGDRRRARAGEHRAH